MWASTRNRALKTSYRGLIVIILNVIKMKNNTSWKEVSKYIKEARKDPEFRRDLKKFICISSGKSK